MRACPASQTVAGIAISQVKVNDESEIGLAGIDPTTFGQVWSTSTGSKATDALLGKLGTDRRYRRPAVRRRTGTSSSASRSR